MLLASYGVIGFWNVVIRVLNCCSLNVIPHVSIHLDHVIHQIRPHLHFILSSGQIHRLWLVLCSWLLMAYI